MATETRIRETTAVGTTWTVTLALLGRYAWRAWVVPAIVLVTVALCHLYFALGLYYTGGTERAGVVPEQTTSLPITVLLLSIVAWSVMWWRWAAPFALSLGLPRRETFATAAGLSLALPIVWLAMFTVGTWLEVAFQTDASVMGFWLDNSTFLSPMLSVLGLGPIGIVGIGVTGTVWAGWGLAKAGLTALVAVLGSWAYAALETLMYSSWTDPPQGLSTQITPLIIELLVITPLILWVQYRFFRRLSV